MHETFDTIRILAAVCLLAITCRSDWKTRTAEDWAWFVMGSLGMLLLFVTMLSEGYPLLSYAGFGLLLLVFTDIFLDRKPIYDTETKTVGWKGVFMTISGMALLLLLLYSPASMEQKAILLGPVVMIYFFYIMYMVNVVHGGADAKALMSLAVLFPLHPSVAGLPISKMPSEVLGEVFFPFSFMVLFYAALSTLAVPLFLLVRNAGRGDLSFPKAFLGYKKDITTDPGFCWPMETIEVGKLVTHYRPPKNTDVESQIKELRNAGYDVVWVTPKIPFLIPIFAGLILAVVLGNPFVFLL